MKSYLKKYVSNTLASTQNQLYFKSNGDMQISRVYIKPFCTGLYEYSFLFEDAIDSTFSDGRISVANETSGKWTIHKAKAMVFDRGDRWKLLDSAREHLPKKEVNLTFNSSLEKLVLPGESFYTDPVALNIGKNEDLCIEVEFSGEKIPYFEEIIIPTYKYENGTWIDDKRVISPSMIGIERVVEKKIGFLGDSITEGIGTDKDSYEHWNSKIANLVGNKYSYWNLGIGFARANDAASDGNWLRKAKEMDVVTICLGVNDMGRGYTAEQIISNLTKIAEILQENKVRTILFTVPPFDYNEENNIKWRKVNTYIMNELSKITEVYDVVKIWGQDAPNEHMARYGGHPNAEGCMQLALDFVKKIDL